MTVSKCETGWSRTPASACWSCQSSPRQTLSWPDHLQRCREALPQHWLKYTRSHLHTNTQVKTRHWGQRLHPEDWTLSHKLTQMAAEVFHKLDSFIFFLLPELHVTILTRRDEEISSVRKGGRMFYLHRNQGLCLHPWSSWKVFQSTSRCPESESDNWRKLDWRGSCQITWSHVTVGCIYTANQSLRTAVRFWVLLQRSTVAWTYLVQMMKVMTSRCM